MSSTQLKAGWTIRVHRKGKLIEEHNVPSHRLSDDDVKKLLISLVAKYEDVGFADFVDLHLNKRKGGPRTGTLPGPVKFKNPEKRMAGYECFGSTVDAIACFPISEELANIVLQDRNRPLQKR